MAIFVDRYCTQKMYNVNVETADGKLIARVTSNHRAPKSVDFIVEAPSMKQLKDLIKEKLLEPVVIDYSGTLDLLIDETQVYIKFAATTSGREYTLPFNSGYYYTTLNADVVFANLKANIEARHWRPNSWIGTGATIVKSTHVKDEAACRAAIAECIPLMLEHGRLKNSWASRHADLRKESADKLRADLETLTKELTAQLLSIGK